MKNHTKYSALITSSLLIVALAGPANATEPVRDTSTIDVQPLSSFSADAAASVSFEKPAVKTTPAPVALKAPVVATVSSTVGNTPAPTAPPSGQVTTAKTELQPINPVSASGKGAAIAAAAYAQIGVAQDCTMLVTNSLRAVGINFHGWPREYFSLGSVTADPQPGDLIYYNNAGAGVPHIAVYVGNGMAIHGGWNGGTTALYKANIGTGATYIRVA